jgi:prepilin-type N-terminal cleavage/methylation domain-containing protein
LARFLLYNFQYNFKLLENSMQLKKQTGFTLVEIAIVLVIVGLLIGGVLKGQEMITNAKLKRMESDNAGLAAGMFSYQDRYLQLPGDDSGAFARFDVYSTATAANINGNSTGIIEGLWDADNVVTIDASAIAETAKFFGHLRASGMIAGTGLDGRRPTNAYGGQIGIQNGSLGIAAGNVTIFGAIEGPVAKILEGRLDDGIPRSGRIQAAVVIPTTIMIPVSGYLTSGPATYNDDLIYHMAFRI